MVNTDRNLSRLRNPTISNALDSHHQLRDVDDHRLQDSDFQDRPGGHAQRFNPSKKLNAGEIRRLCIENHERLEKIKDLFSTGAATEASEVLQHLKSQIEQADKPWC